jgi:hypothetical protein
MGETPHALVFTKTGKGYVNNRGSRDLTASIPVGKAAMYFAIREGNDFPSTE